eukprot:4857225-Amphidinium_carterae.1
MGIVSLGVSAVASAAAGDDCGGCRASAFDLARERPTLTKEVKASQNLETFDLPCDYGYVGLRQVPACGVTCSRPQFRCGCGVTVGQCSPGSSHESSACDLKCRTVRRTNDDASLSGQGSGKINKNQQIVKLCQ